LEHCNIVVFSSRPSVIEATAGARRVIEDAARSQWLDRFVGDDR
jgi:hypothetical protein